MPKAVIRIRKSPAYRRDAIVSGLQRLGYAILDGERSHKEWYPESRDDLLVLWNKKAGLDERMADTWELRGGTVIVVENAYLQKVDKTSYALSVHGHNGSGWFPDDGTDRFTKLGIPLHDPVDRSNGYVLIIGQRGIGSKLMASPALWGEQQLKGFPPGAAKLRQHPGNFKPKVPLAVDFANARSVRIWSSSAGVRALVEGLPVEYAAPHWVCGKLPRELALNHMAHGQWTVAEIASGEPFVRMKAENWGPTKWR